MPNIKIIARPWQPQDLIDDLQSIIDEEPDNYMNDRRTTLCVARDYLKEHFAEQKWIPVTERLPEQCEAVIVWTSDKELGKAARYGSRFFLSYDDEFANVTHWMPLPEKPEGE